MIKESDNLYEYVIELEKQYNGYYKIFSSLRSLAFDYLRLKNSYLNDKNIERSIQSNYDSVVIMQIAKLALAIHIKQLTKPNT